MATDKNFIVKNGLEVGGQEVISSSGVVSSAALGGQTLGTTDSPTFANTTLTGSLRGPATFTIDPAAVGDNTGTLVIAGNLQVDGTTTTINSTTMEVDDLNITLASGAANAAAANGAGITVDGASATITYDGTNDEWDFNKDINVTGYIDADNFKINGAQGTDGQVLTSTGSGIAWESIPAGTTINNNADNRIITGSGTADTLNGESGLTYDGSTLAVTGDANFDSNTLFVDASANSVGIGTSSPSEDLTIASTSPQIRFEDTDASGTPYSKVSGVLGNIYIQADEGNEIADSKIDFRVDGTQRMVIDSSGNVGIGTSSPDASFKTTLSGLFGLRIQSADTNNSALNIGCDTSSGVSFIDSTKTGTGTFLPLRFATNDAERMRIDTSGNLGIGTTSPTEKLTVNGALAITGALVDDRTSTAAMDFSGGVTRFVSYGASGTGGIFAFRTASGGASSTERMRINSTGVVSIGNTENTGYSDDYLLQIGTDGSGSNSFGMVIRANQSGTSKLGFADGADADATGKVWYDHSSNYMRFDTAGSERMRIASNGTMGFGMQPLGANSGSAFFDGNVSSKDGFMTTGTNLQLIQPSATNTIFVRDNGNESMRIDASGNVGIGTTSPAAPLHVNGDVKADTLQLQDDSKMGFGTANAAGSVGHTAAGPEGIFWHSDRNSYGVYRTTGAWSGDYQQLQLDWTTGIIINGGNAYGKSGTRIIGDLIAGAGSGYPHSASINSAYFHSTGDTSQPACRFTQTSNSNSYTIMRLRHESTTAGNYIEFRTDENVLTGIIQDVSGTMSYQSASDSRLKENVESMSEGLTEVLAMNPVKFTWKDIVTENKTVDMESAESRGFLAQELNEQYPWAVSEGGEDEKEKPWSVDYGKLTPVLVKAIQELKAELDAAKARITELEG